ncbi:MAG: PAS domain S-box protein [Candidatus Edwardsbacteria bacterium]|nr:PAS domain S-box protein [Candidatus Edwardsbacteria bacterium]
MTEHRYAILLIDDDPVDRAAMRRFFDEQRLPYEVTDAGSLAEALASIGGHRYDVILSDYLLGEGTGLDVLHRAGGTPVIFVTGHGDEAIAARALRQGAYDYIIKDHDRHYLTALPGAISNSLLRRQAEQALAESERRNRELLENLPSGVYQTTPAGAVLYANPALVRMLRYDSFEGLARINLQQQAMAPAPDRESFFAALDRDGHVANHESIWRARDGQRIVVRESATAVRAADGSVLYYEGWVEDISSRRLAEEKERQYLRELSVLYETTSLLNSMDGIEGIFQYLGEVLRELTNGPYLIICRYEPDDGTIRIHSSWGFEQQLGRVTEALGLEPRTLAIRTDEMTAEELGWFTSGKLMAVPGGLHTLSARRLPRAVCRAVERLLGVRQVQSMGFTIEGRLYGGVVVLLRQGDTIENRPVVETIINQAALAIQRKWAELQLRQSEEFSRTVIEHSPVGITVRDRAGRLLIHNGAWQRICRITDADIPRVRQVDMETIIRSYASWGVDTARVAEVFDRGGTLAFPELRVVDQDDGSVTWISQQIYGITGRDGVVDRVVSLTQDVSERKRADEDLRNNEERFRALLKNSSDIITIVDADQTIRYASPSAGTVLGLAPDAVAGRPLLSLVHPDDVPAVRRTLRRNLSLVGPLPPVECRIRHADGSWRTLEHIAQNLIADPVINGVIINSRDVTERRQADQLQHAIYKLSELTNAAGDMGEFFAGIHRVVAELMYARNFFICLLDPATQQLTYPYFVDEFDLPPQSRRMGRGLTEYIIRHNQPLLAFREHLRKLMDESAVDIQGALPTALLAVPLKTSQATIGALVVQSYADSMFFVERDKEILTYVAQQVAVALERKRTQEALRRSEADLRAVFNSSNQVFILLDLHQKIKSFNSRAADWSQAYCGRALRQDDLIYYYLAPDQADGFTAQINTAKQGRSLAAELPFVRQGEQHWFEAGFNPVHDASGQVYGVCLTLMDIDERRRAVAALARSEERFRAMVQHSSDDIIVVDAAGTITYESTHVLGYDPGALLGTSAYDLVHPDDRPRVMDALQSHLDQPGLIRQIEYRARRADGTWVYLESVGNNLLRDPVVSGIIINSRDISERKQSEALQAALYRIEEITNTAGDLQEFYAAVHRVIEALIYTPNFFIALYDPATRRVSFPYFIDEMDSPPPPRELANGLTDYIITTGEPLFLTGDGAERIQLDKGIATIGSPSVDWLGVPLKSGEPQPGIADAAGAGHREHGGVGGDHRPRRHHPVRQPGLHQDQRLRPRRGGGPQPAGMEQRPAGRRFLPRDVGAAGAGAHLAGHPDQPPEGRHPPRRGGHHLAGAGRRRRDHQLRGHRARHHRTQAGRGPAAGALRHRRTDRTGREHAGVLPRDPRHRPAADGDREHVHRPLRPGQRYDELPVLGGRARPALRAPPTERWGHRLRDQDRPAVPRFPRRADPPLDVAGPGPLRHPIGRVAGGPAQAARADDRRAGGAELQRQAAVRREGQGAAELRLAAHLHGPGAPHQPGGAEPPLAGDGADGRVGGDHRPRRRHPVRQSPVHGGDRLRGGRGAGAHAVAVEERPARCRVLPVPVAAPAGGHDLAGILPQPQEGRHRLRGGGHHLGGAERRRRDLQFRGHHPGRHREAAAAVDRRGGQHHEQHRLRLLRHPPRDRQRPQLDEDGHQHRPEEPVRLAARGAAQVRRHGHERGGADGGPAALPQELQHVRGPQDPARRRRRFPQETGDAGHRRFQEQGHQDQPPLRSRRRQRLG